MNNIVMLSGAEPRKVLHAVIEKKVPVILSYLSKGKQHIAKVVIAKLGANILELEVSPRKEPQPINVNINQDISVSLKYGYGKFVFESKVVDFKPSPNCESGGILVINVPARIELVQRRNYFRVNVPKSMKVCAKIWHGSTKDNINDINPKNYWEGTLVDISAGGTQVAIDANKKQNFRAGQFVIMQFTPVPYESPLIFNAQIRKVLLSADKRYVCVGLQITGLETSEQGRQTLQRLCDVVEQYYRLNQIGIKQQDMQELMV